MLCKMRNYTLMQSHICTGGKQMNMKTVHCVALKYHTKNWKSKTNLEYTNEFYFVSQKPLKMLGNFFQNVFMFFFFYSTAYLNVKRTEQHWQQCRDICLRILIFSFLSDFSAAEQGEGALGGPGWLNFKSHATASLSCIFRTFS